MKNFGLFLIIVIAFGSIGHAQVTSKLDKQIKKKKTYSEDVIDEVYGITMYEKLNPMLDGDSTRMCMVMHVMDGLPTSMIMAISFTKDIMWMVS